MQRGERSWKRNNMHMCILSSSCWVSLAALSPRASALHMRSAIPKMQYGSQHGYGAQHGYSGQQGYVGQQGGAQHGDGGQQSYQLAGGQHGYYQQGGTQQGYGTQSLWRVDGFSGVTGHATEPRYQALPYLVPSGDETILGRWNMLQPKPTVSRVQALVRVDHDGTPTLISCGRPATLWRRGAGPWNGLVKGQTHLLADGDQVSLDWAYPEGTVFTCVQLQGGHPQQEAYPQPLEVPSVPMRQQQLVGGYGYPQQGGYPSYQGQGGYTQQY